MQPFVVFVLDATGSMDQHKQATMSGYNEYLGTLRKQDPDTPFGLITFNSMNIKANEPTTVGQAADLTDDTYQCDHMTPLYDAVMAGVSYAKQHKAKGQKVILTVLTDGLENSSKEYRAEQVKAELEKRQKDKGWTVVYLGANQDAWAAGSAIGVNKATIQTFDQGKTRATFSAVAEATLGAISDPAKGAEAFWADTDTKTFAPDDLL